MPSIYRRNADGLRDLFHQSTEVFKVRLVLLFTCMLTMLDVATVRAQAPVMGAKPILVIEDDGGATYSFNRVTVRRLSDGRILAASGADLHFFDRSGRHLSKAGGQGKGPGEFQYISDLLVLPGDTLLVNNVREQVWLTPQGRYVRQRAIDFEPLTKDGWFSEGSSLLSNGNLLATQYVRESPALLNSRELRRPALRYSLYAPTSGTVTPILDGGGLRQLRYSEHGSAVQPFTPHAQNAVGTDRVYVGDNDSTFVKVFSFDGKLLHTIRVNDREIPVTKRDLDASYQRMMEFAGTNAARIKMVQDEWAVVPKPKRFPFWGRLIADKTGNLWVSSPTGRDAPVIWTVFDSKGAELGTLAMPARFDLQEVGTDYLLGISRDEDDVESIQLFALQRGAARR